MNENNGMSTVKYYILKVTSQQPRCALKTLIFSHKQRSQVVKSQIVAMISVVQNWASRKGKRLEAGQVRVGKWLPVSAGLLCGVMMLTVRK